MSIAVPHPRLGRRRPPGRRPLAAPALASLALLVAVFAAPFRLAALGSDGRFADRTDLAGSVRSGFLQFWSAGTGALGPELQRTVDLWFRFHLLKAGLAALLLVAVGVLLVRTAGRVVRAGSTPRRLAAVAAVVAESAVGLLALLVTVANAQGAVAPLSSVLGLLPLGRPDPELAAAVSQARRGLRDGVGEGALSTLVHDFTVYHVAMVALGALTTAALVGLAVLAWRRRPAPGSGRRAAVAGCVGLAVLAAGFAVITAANLSTALRPLAPLAGFLAGGG